MLGRDSFLRFMSYAKNSLMPQQCYLCKDWLFNEDPLCQRCIVDLPYLQGLRCCQCLVALDFGSISVNNNYITDGAQNYCGNCQGENFLFSSVSIPFLYKDFIAQMICSFKYHEDFLAGYCLARLLANNIDIKKLSLIDAIIPVPLHKKRFYQRGFNQSLIFSRLIGKKISVPILKSACRRVKNTPSQTSLSLSARHTNCINAFRVNKKSVVNKNILLVDDVYTTGSTARIIAKQLLKASCNSVSYVAVSRA